MEMPLTAGTRLGPYEIQSAIGAGGMGEVYRAHDSKLKRDVALKILPAHTASDPDRRARFEREAQSIAALNHPNIVTIYSVEEAGGALFLTMELVDGQPLDHLIDKGGLPLARILALAIPLTDAVSAAHQKGITHRDLKPANVMVTAGGRVKVLDFGLAKLVEATPVAAGVSELPTRVLTGEGRIVGTVAYMSPEQAEGKSVDHRSDIFSLGVMLYELATGERPFKGDTAVSTMSSILRDTPRSISELNQTLPRDLALIVRRCLAKNPEQRTQSAKDLRNQLEDLQHAMDSGELPASVEPAEGLRGKSLRRHGRRERVAWALLGVAVLGLVILSVPAMLYMRRDGSEPVVTRLDVITPPTREAFSFALSPDGRQLVYVAGEGGRSRLWLRPLDQATAAPLSGTDDASYPFWAPDGRAIGFFASGKLKRLNLTGGAPQDLAVALQPRGGTWSQDDIIVFAPSGQVGLMRVPASGGTPTPVTQLAEGQGSHRWPQFLSDGRRFVYLAALGRAESTGVYVGSVDGGEPTRVLMTDTSAMYAPGFLLFVLSNGQLVAQRFDEARTTVAGEPTAVAQGVSVEEGVWRAGFSVSTAGVLAHRAGELPSRQLTWVDRSGKVLRTIRPRPGAEDAPGTLGTLSHPSLTPDGQRVVVALTIRGNPDVWLVATDTGVMSRFTTSPAIDSSALWKPDGKTIVFRSSRTGVNDLFEAPADSAADERLLLATEHNKSPLDWSRDGRFLLYAVGDPKTATDLWVLPMTGPADARKPFSIVQTSFDEIQGTFSPDGRWIAYASDVSGRYEIYVKPFPDVGRAFPVSTAGGTSPRWGHDGHELFYVATDNQLMSVPIRPGRDPGTLNAGAPLALFPIDLALGGPTPRAGFNSRAQYEVTPEGQFLMNVIAGDAATGPITVVLNWQEELKQRVPTR